MIGRLLVPLAAVTLAAFAGCLDDDWDDFPPAYLVPEDADSEFGSGSYAMRIRVTSETRDGSPLAGAAVAAFTGFRPHGDPWAWEYSYDYAWGSEGDSWTGSRITASWSESCCGTRYDYDSAMGGRTDDTGAVLAHLEPGSTVTLLASAPGHTTEKRIVVVGAANETGTVTLPLYRDVLVVERPGQLGPAGHAAKPLLPRGPSQNAHELAAVVFGPDEAHPLYVERLAALRVTVTWDNGLTAYADLAAAANPGPGAPRWWHDSRSEWPASQGNEESLDLGPEDLREVRDTARAGGATDLRTGALTRSVSLGVPEGSVGYTVTTTAFFRGADLRLE